MRRSHGGELIHRNLPKDAPLPNPSDGLTWLWEVLLRSNANRKKITTVTTVIVEFSFATAVKRFLLLGSSRVILICPQKPEPLLSGAARSTILVYLLLPECLKVEWGGCI